MDFKVSITQPLAEHGEWAEANYDPIESEFMDKLKAIEGTSQHETQEISALATSARASGLCNAASAQSWRQLESSWPDSVCFSPGEL